MSSSQRSPNSPGGQQPQRASMTQTIMIVMATMVIFMLFQKTFSDSKKQALKTDTSVAEAMQEIDTQLPEPEEPGASGEKMPAALTAADETKTPGNTVENVPESGTPDAGEKPADAPGTPEIKEAEENLDTPTVAPALVSLGSADPESPYRMLVTLANYGAAVATVEMNEPQLVSMSDAPDFRGGYLGILNFRTGEEDAVAEYKHIRNLVVLQDTSRENPSGSMADPAPAIVAETIPTAGCHVDVVGAGTAAEKAGLKVGDLIFRMNDEVILSHLQLQQMLLKYAPGQEVKLTVARDGAVLSIFANLARQPAKIIAPENGDQLAFLTTLSTFGGQSLDSPYGDMKDRISKTDGHALHAYLNKELRDIRMRATYWEVESQTQDTATFLYRMPKFGLEIRKTYCLAVTPENETKNLLYPSYHLTLNVEVRNIGTLARKVALQQDGPTGLPTEGHWFCSKTARGMFEMVGIRDVITGYENSNTPMITSCQKIADGKWGLYEPNESRPVKYIGVDAQYFSAILIPDKSGKSVGLSKYAALRVGNVPDPWVNCTDTSCRVRTEAKSLNPGETAEQEFKIFLGPKRPSLLSRYELDNVVYYGWFGFISVFLTWILHFFYHFFGNYGVAIILLTACVRLAMFPLSKKQVKGALVMQKLQPEMKKINEKYEDPQERQKATMQLWKEHNYNPMSGCWVMLIQLPIFIALYRALLVDVELRHAPLISDGIRFCSNLAAPDRMFYWKPYVWDMISTGYGFFGLGPYLNLLPILTIIIFLVQQKMLMPPAIDDQQKMSQNMMKYMMVFMGFIFFKVPSGLCIYFIASSLWGLAERQIMPKADPSMETVPSVIDVKSTKLKKETFMEKMTRIAAGKEAPKAETPDEKKKRRAKKK